MTQLLQQAVGQRMAKQMPLPANSSAEHALRCGPLTKRSLMRSYPAGEADCRGHMCRRSEIVTIIKDLIELQNGILNEAFAREREGFKVS